LLCRQFGWDVRGALLPLGDKAQVFEDIDELVAAVSRAAREGDHILVMSNGGFCGIHARLLQTLALKFQYFGWDNLPASNRPAIGQQSASTASNGHNRPAIGQQSASNRPAPARSAASRLRRPEPPESANRICFDLDQCGLKESISRDSVSKILNLNNDGRAICAGEILNEWG
jgi:hypothetical protein